MPDADRNLKWLRKKAKGVYAERDALFVYLLGEGVESAEAAERSGFGGGKSDDPKRRRKAYQTAASSALTSARIQLLQKAYAEYRERGELTEVVSREERRRILSDTARTGTASEKKQAVSELNKMDAEDSSAREAGDRKNFARAFLASCVAESGAQAVIDALVVFRVGHLRFLYPDAFADPVDGIEDRISRLEQEQLNEQRPVEGTIGDDARNPDAGGARRTGGATAPAVDRGHGELQDVDDRRGERGGEGAEQRDGDGGKVTADDEAAMQEWQRSIGL